MGRLVIFIHLISLKEEVTSFRRGYVYYGLIWFIYRLVIFVHLIVFIHIISLKEEVNFVVTSVCILLPCMVYG